MEIYSLVSDTKIRLGGKSQRRIEGKWKGKNIEKSVN